MRISYAITVCNEDKELDQLLEILKKSKDNEDEIVVQCDKGNTTQEVYNVLEKHDQQYIEYPLNNHFANFKNNLKENCNGDWIFQIDADELPDNYLIKNLKKIIKANKTVELMSVPRVNKVEGLTQKHIYKWGWILNEKEWINWPDYQNRIILNNSRIKWVNRVHEKIYGFQKAVRLPKNTKYCLYHFKHIKKQEQQNKYYDSL